MGWIGARLPRREDADLLTGRARTVADLRAEDVGAGGGVLELAFVRSPLAHARVLAVDAAPARGLPGVVGAWSAADLPELPDVPPAGPPEVFAGLDQPSLARDRVRWAGQALAVVAATSRAAAEDGAAAVRVELAELPALPTPADALAPDVPLLFPSRERARERGNTADVHTEGSDPGEVAAAIAAAPVVVEARYREQRVLPSSLEGRSVLAVPAAAVPEPPQGSRAPGAAPTPALAVHASHQAQHRLRSSLAGALGLAEGDVRVVVPATGGAFGAKSQTYPEHLVAAFLALRLGRPVRWVEDRAEALLCATRGRGQDQRARLAATTEGDLLAYELHLDADIGGHPHTGLMVPSMTTGMAPGAYRTPLVAAQVRAVLTTTPPTSAYRGAGRPEAAFAIERTMDRLARALGMDPADLRRRNLVRTFPHTTPTGRELDSGDYLGALDLALHEVGYEHWRAEQRRRRLRGATDPAAPQIGIGLCTYVERSGAEGVTDEHGSVEVDPGATDRAAFVVRVGSTATGQGHLTVFAQIAAEALGVDVARVRVMHNDTAEVPYGFGTFGSRSTQVGGASVFSAATGLVAAARERAAAHWGVGAEEVTWDAGSLRAPGGRRLDAADLVARTGPLRVDERFEAPWSFPYGAYAAVVEVEPELGVVAVLRLVAVDDYGVVVNPLLVDGQGYGSVAQGLGQALWESAEPGADGLPIADDWLTYLLPVAGDVPPVDLRELEHPNPHVPHGAKGAGEAGCIGVPPALVNAVCDALGVDDVPMPMTPEVVWRAAEQRAWLQPAPALTSTR